MPNCVYNGRIRLEATINQQDKIRARIRVVLVSIEKLVVEPLHRGYETRKLTNIQWIASLVGSV